jgi:hypothetical protein
LKKVEERGGRVEKEKKREEREHWDNQKQKKREEREY